MHRQRKIESPAALLCGLPCRKPSKGYFSAEVVRLRSRRDRRSEQRSQNPARQIGALVRAGIDAANIHTDTLAARKHRDRNSIWCWVDCAAANVGDHPVGSVGSFGAASGHPRRGAARARDRFEGTPAGHRHRHGGRAGDVRDAIGPRGVSACADRGEHRGRCGGRRRICRCPNG